MDNQKPTEEARLDALMMQEAAEKRAKEKKAFEAQWANWMKGYEDAPEDERELLLHALNQQYLYDKEHRADLKAAKTISLPVVKKVFQLERTLRECVSTQQMVGPQSLAISLVYEQIPIPPEEVEKMNNLQGVGCPEASPTQIQVRFVTVPIVAESSLLPRLKLSDEDSVSKIALATVEVHTLSITQAILSVSNESKRTYSRDKVDELGPELRDLANVIYMQILRGPATFIWCAPDITDTLKALTGSQATEKDNVTGLRYVGRYHNLRVYENKFLPESTLIVGYKGKDARDAGIIFCPYVSMSHAIVGAYEDGTDCVMTRFTRTVTPDGHGAKSYIQLQLV